MEIRRDYRWLRGSATPFTELFCTIGASRVTHSEYCEIAQRPLEEPIAPQKNNHSGTALTRLRNGGNEWPFGGRAATGRPILRGIDLPAESLSAIAEAIEIAMYELQAPRGSRSHHRG
jgi:hypothetical protein